MKPSIRPKPWSRTRAQAPRRTTRRIAKLRDWRGGGLALAALVCASLAAAQSPSLTRRSGEIAPIQLELLAPAHATGGLDLVLTDNGVAVPAAAVHPIHPDGPTQLLVVLDGLNCDASELTRSVDAIRTVLSAGPATLPQPTSIAFFTATPPHKQEGPDAPEIYRVGRNGLYTVRIPPTTDTAHLLAAVSKLRLGLGGRVQAIPAADRDETSENALGFLAAAVKPDPGSKLVAWIGPGWPLMLEAGTPSQQLFDYVVYLTDLLRSARVVVDVVDPRTAGEEHQRTTPQVYEQFLPRPQTMTDSDPNQLALQTLALDSGGQVLAGSNDIAAQLRSAFDDAARLRGVEYVPANPAHGLRWHAITARDAATGELLRSEHGAYTH